jgi:hypothetical protein
MSNRIKMAACGAVVLFATGCGAMKSNWKIQGGADACKLMCMKWGLHFTAMVGVGDQEDAAGAGATACVCQPRTSAQGGVEEEGSSSSSASLAGPITAQQAAAAAIAANQVRLGQQPVTPTRR